MYLDLYEGLGLTPEDLSPYDSPLVAFDGTIIMPVGQVTLPVEGFDGSRKWSRNHVS